jgi:hypothetical protein
MWSINPVRVYVMLYHGFNFKESHNKPYHENTTEVLRLPIPDYQYLYIIRISYIFNPSHAKPSKVWFSMQINAGEGQISPPPIV